ncbi:unnamed protein product [Caenorhabditis bovis]|uniref:Uncharacterized protein n=1 Tax=Caenorhabditis bovis TaxID=2654633 RepID=A0A8S1F0S6_9PELO|nr:unnamed protein product [Caenorhabditis bovis]
MKAILLAFCIAAVASAERKKHYVEIPEDAELNGTTYTISAFTPKTFVKSAEFELNYTMCVQYSFRLKERRVRLHAYTCQLSTGGFCTLDKFSYPDDQQGCTYLRPWTHKKDTWSFYFVLEKRARQYRKGYDHTRKRKRQTRKATSTEPSGIFHLYGIVPCSEACLTQEEKKLGSYADGTFHRGRSNRLLY